MNACRIAGTGAWCPSDIVRNDDLSARFGVDSAWIVSRTGIEERRQASPQEHASSLGEPAAREAIASAGLQPADIDLLVCATITPESPIPSTACILQARLGLRGVPALDVAAACSGFLYGLETCANAIATGRDRHALLVCVDLLTRLTDPADLLTSVLFGDGAGAIVLSRADAPGLVGIDLGSRGGDAHLIRVPVADDGAPRFMRMAGRELFKSAVATMCETSEALARRLSIDVSRIDHVIPHQANQRIMDAVMDRLGLPEHKLVSNIRRFGNTGAASIPMALNSAVRQGAIRDGELVLFTAFGGGLTYGAAFLRW